MDDFVERAQGRLNNLQTQDQHLEATLRGIMEQREAIEAEMGKLRAALEIYRTLMDIPASTPPKQQAPLVGEDFRMMTVADATEAIMRSQGGQAEIALVQHTLENAGKLRVGHNAYSTIVKTLQRFPTRFKKVKRGVWALSEPATNGAAPAAPKMSL